MRFSRDVSFLVLGAAIGIPTGIFSNYLYDMFFPTIVSVETKQVGVQGLGASPEYIYLYRTRPEIPKNGYIEVRYAQGSEPSAYKCNVKVSNPEIFKSLGFRDDCRRAEYVLKEPASFPNIFVDNTFNVSFEITIHSPGNPQWVGSQSVNIGYFVEAYKQ